MAASSVVSNYSYVQPEKCFAEALPSEALYDLNERFQSVIAQIVIRYANPIEMHLNPRIVRAERILPGANIMAIAAKHCNTEIIYFSVKPSEDQNVRNFSLQIENASYPIASDDEGYDDIITCLSDGENANYAPFTVEFTAPLNLGTILLAYQVFNTVLLRNGIYPGEYYYPDTHQLLLNTRNYEKKETGVYLRAILQKINPDEGQFSVLGLLDDNRLGDPYLSRALEIDSSDNARKSFIEEISSQE